MRKHNSTKGLIRLRTKQLGNHICIVEGGYSESGDIKPDHGDNRQTRRMLKSLMQKKKAPYTGAHDLPTSALWISRDNKQGENK
ncbi:TPA: hypothetical protein ACJTPC_003271 [Providencia alcalifaciens]